MRSKKVLLATALVMASVAAGAPAPAMAQGVNWIHATIGALCERDGQSFFVNVYNVTTEPNSSSLWGRCELIVIPIVAQRALLRDMRDAAG